MTAAETAKKIPASGDVSSIKTISDYRSRLQELSNRIHAATNLDEILIDMKDDICTLFNVERVTIYVVDGVRRELVSRYKSGSEVGEIRVPIANMSVVGYAASKQKLINVKDVYDDKELAAIDPVLRFDKRWDKKANFQTKQVLAHPITFKNFLLGAMQLINKKDNHPFSVTDEQAVAELTKTLGIALYNQRRMVRARPNKFDYLVNNSIITSKELEKAVADARQNKEPVETILVNEFKVSKKDVLTSLSQFYRTPYILFSDTTPIPGDLLKGVKVPFMKNNLWVPIREEDGRTIVAIDNPADVPRMDMVKALFPGKNIEFHICLKDDILAFIKHFTTDEKEMSSIDDILGQLQVEEDEMDDEMSRVGEEDSAVVQLVNKIILDAYARNASDIHIEPYPGKQSTRVRIRVDGACAVYQMIPYQYRNALVSRIKIMSDLDIAERRKPQDGKIKFSKYGGKDIELRVATVPTQGGMEDVVMRILAAGEPIPLNKMGFSKLNYENFISCIIKPYGIIFVCGPTGSGKTTTLHSALGYINKPDIKIWTAEDPVEITQAGLRQVQVKPKIGFDFAAAMRAFLRADPDVIMVGEMRDKETTHIGIEASLTGHLVFSTLHTNSAPESVTRLLDMGMDPFNFADAVLCILAQRLGRTLCSKCKEPYNPSEDEFNELVREYEEGEKGALERNLGIKYSKDLVLHRAKGCDACNQTGYRGRCGIHELLMGTDDCKKLIQLRTPMEGIRTQAIKDGMTTLKQDGIGKIFEGKLDLLQVRKVCIK
jgi:type II secretory ATPase GspE/PulE/Tfp pilus assembly ATPase PilB-like protein/putative methionine-R-sulfoxide reductase with GAF domain